MCRRRSSTRNRAEQTGFRARRRISTISTREPRVENEKIGSACGKWKCSGNAFWIWNRIFAFCPIVRNFSRQIRIFTKIIENRYVSIARFRLKQKITVRRLERTNLKCRKTFETIISTLSEHNIELKIHNLSSV